MVCLRLPHEDKPGKRVQRVWNVSATTNAILELADHLACQGVTRVVMEATPVSLAKAPRLEEEEIEPYTLEEISRLLEAAADRRHPVRWYLALPSACGRAKPSGRGGRT